MKYLIGAICVVIISISSSCQKDDYAFATKIKEKAKPNYDYGLLCSCGGFGMIIFQLDSNGAHTVKEKRQ